MKYILLFLILISSHLVFAQTAEKDVFEIYERQYNGMIKSRGMPDSFGFTQVIGGFNTAGLKSNKDFANVLKNLYGDKEKIGVVFFFYNEGILHRTFFKPGKVLEEKKIKISPQKLAELHSDLLMAFKIQAKSANRSPIKRGVVVKNIGSNVKKVNLEVLTKEIGNILLPTGFDETVKQLIVIPALNIGTFPFHILKPYNDNSYLIDKCSFTISPGIVDLIVSKTVTLRETIGGEWQNGKYLDQDGYTDRNRHLPEKRRFTLDNPLFISNPAYPKNLEYEFPNLPGAAKEIAGAISYAKNYYLLSGKNATKDSVFKYWEEADLIYFATHGIADETNPIENSYLVLSGDDAKLTARDVMNLAVKGKSFPEMVILSACQTGLGKSVDVGVTGLARSFILGGTKQVIMSLWNVDDEATAFLMERFIIHLQAPNFYLPSEQLRLAILDTKKKYPNPMYWASFSVFGVSY
ncbi:CHAT domain-containing protein [Pedobacter frigiditerrae]|uniref:CHAT domain-containing protein n=1 Tax=Pedobacter frigiditerrae TaxID=2530452 RepID=UPI00292CC1E1|nr:CHAT domain-containing protein [Pedobacter frigiditerrae]